MQPAHPSPPRCLAVGGLALLGLASGLLAACGERDGRPELHRPAPAPPMGTGPFRRIATFPARDSLGSFYEAATEFCGFGACTAGLSNLRFRPSRLRQRTLVE